MAHLHMTKDAVNIAQEKREAAATPSEKKIAEPTTTGMQRYYKIKTSFKLINRNIIIF